MALENVEGFYPLTPLQQGLLFESLLHPESGAYFNQMMATLDESADLDRLEEAWKAVVARHPILRTGFVWEGVKEPVQVVERSADLPWSVEDWSHRSASERQRDLETYLAEERAEGFDLTRAPLMRFRLTRMGEDGVHFVWSFHHLLLDGWSMYLVLSEVFETYERLGRGESPASVERPLFRSYVAWTRRSDTEGAKAYWRRRMAGARPAPLSVGRPEAHGVAERVEDSRWVTRTLSPEATEALGAMCRSRHLTLNSAVMGAWAFVLSRYTDRDDVVFGSTVSGRSPELTGADDMVGLLINTLPVRVEFDDEAAVGDWLASIQADQAEQRQYEYTPLFAIQGWCDLPQNEPLFDTVYLFENYRKGGSLEDLGQALGVRDIDWYERTNYPIAVLAVPGDELSLKAIYHRQSFSRDSVERLLDHWVHVIESFAREPDARLGEVQILLPEEQERMLRAWNDTEADVDLSRSVHELVAEQARVRPDAPAVVDGASVLTYSELEERAASVAAALSAMGVHPGDFVAICLERSAELIAGVLGILKAGAAYVPLDPASPDDRLEYMLEDSRASALVTWTPLLERLPAELPVRAKTLLVDEGWPDLDTAVAEPATVGVDGLAYMIYTSGSTGRPKGTTVTHASLLNLVEWHWRAFDIGAEDRATQVAGPAFDAFGWEIWPYLTRGASVTVVPRSTAADPEALRDWLVETRTTVSFLPTPLAERVLDLTWPEAAPLRSLLTGGDRLRRPPRPGLPFELVNNYGPTENTVVTTSCVVEPAGDSEEVPPIGRPIANNRLYVLDAKMRPVPIGVPGELYVGGASLAVGYHGRPELTAEKFVPDPFSDSGRLYRTGDLVSYRPDGTLDFLGRTDFQVKIRGFRVELGEIEALLSRHEDISEAVVVPTEQGRLVGYTVAVKVRPEDGVVRTWLREQLPEYMVPSHFVWLDELPLTPNGKVDRAALPEPVGERPDLDAEYEAPATDTERTLAEIWGRVLSLSKVGRNDNFFDLGGHSLSITEVYGAIRQRLTTDIKLVDLFNYPTVASVAALIDGGQDEEQGAARKGRDRAAMRREALQRRRTNRGRRPPPGDDEARR